MESGVNLIKLSQVKCNYLAWRLFYSPKTTATLLNYTCKSFIKLMMTVIVMMTMMMMMMMLMMTMMIATIRMMLMIVMIAHDGAAFGRLFLAKVLTEI